MKTLIILIPVFISYCAIAQSGPNGRWADTFSNDQDELSKLYTENAIIIANDGQIFKESKQIDNYYLTLKKDIQKINTIESTGEVEVNPSLTYEIGRFISISGDRYDHLIIWRKVGDSQLRELEIISHEEKSKPDLAEIDKARKKWIDLCNTHDPLALVSNMYTSDAIYYNHKPVVRGIDAIAATYSYMKRPAYRLSLSPIFIEAVNAETVFEIGQCAGSYGGKYLLVWRKTNDEWKVLLDANL